MKRFKGISASQGITEGPALIYEVGHVPLPRRRIREAEVDPEIERVRGALKKTAEEVATIRDLTKQDSASIFTDVLDAHLMLLEDKALLDGVSDVITSCRWNAEFAFYTHLMSITSQLANSQNTYLRDRVGDLMDIGRGVIRNLLGMERPSLAELEDECIIIAHDLSPSDTAQIKPGKVLAFVTEIGSRTSHTAIMARALGIPAVVGVSGLTQEIEAGDPVIVDGIAGDVIVKPSEEEAGRYKTRASDYRNQERQMAERVCHLPAKSLDEVSIALNGNIEFPWELDSLLENGADGVGLYRTEFLFMAANALPSEEEQYNAYREVVERMSPSRVIIRTLDLGGDKFVSSNLMPQEMNPFLGWRAIRFCLERRDIFRTQLRAILRASAHGEVGMMYPMVSSVEELREANAFLGEVREELLAEGVSIGDAIHIGTMIETPAAALCSEQLVEECDFFSIGTNDLIQYTLAVDRVNEKIAHLYKPLHPAVLKLIRRTVDAGHSKGKWVGVCGEMAADPINALVLLSLGVDELSMSGESIPLIKTLIRSIRINDLRGKVADMLSMGTDNEVRQWAKAIAHEILPDWLDIEGGNGTQ